MEEAENLRWKQGDSTSFILDLQSPKSPRLGFLVNGKWNGWSFNLNGSKYQKPDPLYLMACFAYNIEIKIETYKQGKSAISNYIKRKYKNEEF